MPRSVDRTPQKASKEAPVGEPALAEIPVEKNRTRETRFLLFWFVIPFVLLILLAFWMKR